MSRFMSNSSQAELICICLWLNSKSVNSFVRYLRIVSQVIKS